MAKVINKIGLSTGNIERTSDLINDGETGVSTFVEINELGTAAYINTNTLATSAQGIKADNALQPGGNISSLTNDSGYLTTGLQIGDNISGLINDSGYLTSVDVVGTDLTYTAEPNRGLVNSSTGLDAILPIADYTNAGLFSPTDKSKLDGLADPLTIPQIKADSEINDTISKRHSHDNKILLDFITEAFTTTLKDLYDTAYNWVLSNGTNVLNHLVRVDNPHNVTKLQVGLGNVPNLSFSGTNTGDQDLSPYETIANNDIKLAEKANLSSVIRESFTYSGSQLFPLANTVNNVYSVTVRGVGLSLSLGQYQINSGNILQINDTLETVNGVADNVEILYNYSIGDATSYTKVEEDAKLSNKVDKVAGKSLILDTEIARLLSMTAIFTTALKTAYDTASSWVTTNGANVLAHLTRTDNPHSVTKTQVGLSNVDNTSDANKPISTATRTDLNLKANLAGGNTLSGVQTLTSTPSINPNYTEIAGKGRYVKVLDNNGQTILTRQIAYWNGTAFVATDAVFSGYLAGQSNIGSNIGSISGYNAGYNNTGNNIGSISGDFAGYNNTGHSIGSISGYFAGQNNIGSSIGSISGNNAGEYNTGSSIGSISGNSAGRNNIGSNIGSISGGSAGQSNIGDHIGSISGYVAGQNNTGSNIGSISGSSAGQYNIGSSIGSISGHVAGQNNTGSSIGSISGYFAGQSNIGSNIGSISGYYTGQNNIGSSIGSISGYLAGQSNIGSSIGSISGYLAGQNNTGSYIGSISGYVAGRYNTGNKTNIVGDNTYSTFIQNTAGLKSFDNTAINVTAKTITITSHGFGSNGSYVNLYFTQGTSAITGISNTNIIQVKVQDANTLLYAETLPSGQLRFTNNITNAGTGTGHSFTPSVKYDNLNILGADVVPTGSNQTWLGSNLTAQTFIKGAVLLNTTTDNGVDKLQVNGNIQTNALLKVGQFTDGTEPVYVKGAQYFNTTINKMKIGGATTWETLTSS